MTEYTYPTPAEFLALTEPDEPDEAETYVSDTSDPLTSIAASLGMIAAAVHRHGAAEQADTENRELYIALDQAHADLEAKYEDLCFLVEDVLAVCKPSVSKLAIQVRETVARWRAPQTSGAEPVVGAAAESVERVDGVAPDESSAPEPVASRFPPAHDAPVEEWREFARSRGYAGPDVDKANRSQIRTMLGIEQP